MRILRVTQNLYPDVLGGASYHVHALSRDQASLGHDVTVLTVSDNSELPEREETSGYTVVRRKPTVKPIGNVLSVGVAKFLKNASSYDVIHAHSHYYFSTNLAALKRRLSGTPLAITNHGLYSQSASERIFDVYLKTVGRLTFNSADVVFCYTEEDKERVQKLGVNTEINVVPNGIDLEKFTPDTAESDLIDTDKKTVLFVGRLVEGKRPGDAIEAVAELHRSLPEVKLYLCGDGPLRSELERLVEELDLEDIVEFLGHVEYDEMPRVYSSADVMLLPSRAEGLPRTVLESFASGVPVVSSDLEHTAPVVEEAGITVPAGEVECFSEALNEILSNPERSYNFAKRGRKLVEGKFGWDSTVDKTTEKLKNLVNNKRDKEDV